MRNCHSCKTLVVTESKLGAYGTLVCDPTLYRSLDGDLQYLIFTRPDLSYAVQQVCLYIYDPREPQIDALKRILRYVCGCPTTLHSTSGYCVFLGNNLLSLPSKRQYTLSRSSVEAEYRDEVYAPVRNIFLTTYPIPDVKGAFSSLSRDEFNRSTQSYNASKNGNGNTDFVARTNPRNDIGLILIINLEC
ncbi:ribonuclease H-like domain-containing protein [Tanacetum coccineum]